MNCEECAFCEHLEECKQLEYIKSPYEVIEERVFDVETRQYITTRQLVTVVKDRSESNENFRPECKRN